MSPRRPTPARLVSPGFTPRPSLSVRDVELSEPARCPRVAGVHAPAFVERACACESMVDFSWVSPGFTPRPSLSEGGPQRRKRHRRVSPGFTPRPSLSGRQRDLRVVSGLRVAGVHAPAFVERRRYPPPTRACLVSPGFTPRPSLSGGAVDRRDAGARVSPGFTPRPSLSGDQPAIHRVPGPGVAGVHAPAFVERSRSGMLGWRMLRVSPGFTPRPSLSDRTVERRPAGRAGVAGVHAPAFVERTATR